MGAGANVAPRSGNKSCAGSHARCELMPNTVKPIHYVFGAPLAGCSARLPANSIANSFKRETPPEPGIEMEDTTVYLGYNDS